MLLMKNLEVSNELLLLRALCARMPFDAKIVKRLMNLEKGLIGERWFIEWLKRFGWKAIIIPDLKTKINFSSVQVDMLIIAGKTIHVCEVKNYEGEYFFEEDRFYMERGNEIKSPLKQVENIALAFRQLLNHWGSDFEIKHWVVFVNPDMSLSQLRKTDPIIMPHQMNRYFSAMRKQAPCTTAADKKMGQRLLELHDQSISFIDIPEYDAGKLNRGMRCRECNGLSIAVSARTSHCLKCNYTASMYNTIREAALDFRLINSSDQVTVSDLKSFCGDLISKSAIRTALEKEYELVAQSTTSYYKLKV